MQGIVVLFSNVRNRDRAIMKSTRINAYLPNIIVPLAGMSTDIYLPSLPHMVHDFSTSKAMVQITLTTFVFAMGIAQLLAGPISDALGRKQIILSSLLVQLLALVTIIFAPNMTVLIAARLIQGLGAGFMTVPGRAILNDCFSGETLKKKFNYLTISFALGPIIAPFIGGYCEHFFGYQASFAFLVIYVLALLVITCIWYQESLPKKTPFSVGNLFTNYRKIFASKHYVEGTRLAALLFGFTSLFNTLAPFIYQNHFHYSPVQYGTVALLIGVSWFLGNVTNRFIFSIPISKKISTCFAIQLLFISALVISASFHVFDPHLTTVLMLGIVYSNAVIFPNLVGECLSLFPQMAASANALFFAVLWVAFSAYTLLATLIPTKTLLPLGLTYLGLSVLGMLLFYRYRGHIKH